MCTVCGQSSTKLSELPAVYAISYSQRTCTKQYCISLIISGSKQTTYIVTTCCECTKQYCISLIISGSKQRTYIVTTCCEWEQKMI